MRGITALFVLVPAVAFADARSRMDADAAAGAPLVAHVVVALVDNAHQGIVPVPKAIGNGQEPRSNQYWGAAFGVRTYFVKKAGWTLVKAAPAARDGVLDAFVATKTIVRNGWKTQAFVVAEAWDGARMASALARYFALAGGRDAETIAAGDLRIAAGGAAHVVAFVGHDGLMDLPAPMLDSPDSKALPRSAVVLACVSRSFFGPLLAKTGAEPLLMTTGLMAPEAYVLDEALSRWFSGGAPTDVREAAAGAYDRFQKCGIKGARRLFATGG